MDRTVQEGHELSEQLRQEVLHVNERLCHTDTAQCAYAHEQLRETQTAFQNLQRELHAKERQLEETEQAVKVGTVPSCFGVNPPQALELERDALIEHADGNYKAFQESTEKMKVSHCFFDGTLHGSVV